MNIFADNHFIKRRINLTYLILRRHHEMLAAMSYLNEDEYTPVVNEKASEKEKGKERWQVLRHLSGQRPAAVWETSDMKMRAAQPPADLSHRSRQVCPIPHSMKYPSHSILFANCSPCILSLDLLDAPSLFLQFIPPYAYPFLILFVALETNHLPSATRFAHISLCEYTTRCCCYRSIDMYKILAMCTPQYSKYAQDIMVR